MDIGEDYQRRRRRATWFDEHQEMGALRQYH
jgi:hypothetical protein